MASSGKASPAARTALLYITVGALMLVWTGIWYWWLTRHADAVPERTWYWCYGLLLTGLVLLVIGLALGRIGRAARHAELPPPEDLKAAADLGAARAVASTAAGAVPANPPPGAPAAPVAHLAAAPPPAVPNRKA